MADRTRIALGGLRRNQEGQVLIMSLVLLLLSVLVITPLLGYMSAGFTTGIEYQKKSDELYAADAGVREAIWNIRKNPALLATGETIDPLPLLEGVVAGKTLTVSIFARSVGVAGGTYKITSVATSADGSKTTIEAWLDYLPSFFEYAVVTPGDVYFSPGAVVDGKLSGEPGGPGYDPDNPEDSITGGIYDPWDPAVWPFGGTDFRQWYNPQPPPDPPLLAEWGSDSLNVAANPLFGNLLRNGDLDINSSVDDISARLTGTVYVAGSNSELKIGATMTGKAFTLDLNNQAIYVEGGDRLGPQIAIKIGGATTITGSGVIIAEGDIDFFPNISSSPGDYVFIMSLNGEVNFHPSGTMYGTVAGADGVSLGASGTLISYTDPPIDELNFPWNPDDVFHTASIRSWKVIPPLTTSGIGLFVTTGSLPDGNVGVAYSATLAAVGGTTPYTWSITVGSLPSGLALDASTGAISGTPTAAGTYPFTVQATDSAAATATKSLSITVVGLGITTTSPLPDGKKSKGYGDGTPGASPSAAYYLTAAGGTGPYTWLKTGGDAWILVGSDGRVTGTAPGTIGPYNFTVQVTDSASPTPATATKTLTINVTNTGSP